MDNVKKETPIVKSFIYNNSCFIYDTFTNRLFHVSADQFLEISHLQKIGLNQYASLNKDTKAYKDIIMLINKGLFHKPFIKKIEHPETKYVQHFLNRCVNDLTLQVTKNCNFKCRYCLYANDTQFERGHQNVNMSWEIAKKSVDFLFAHSLDAKSINIAFYGGEPLLNYQLIYSIVEYVEKLFYTKKIKYSMTINGSLLTDSIVAFFVKHNFYITVSLDGPEVIQNRHRKFGESGNDTFNVVYRNVRRIKHMYKDYFYSNVTFIPVLFPDEDYQEVLKFYRGFDVSEEQILPLNVSLNGLDYINSNIHTYNFQNTFFIKKEKKNEISFERLYEDKRNIPSTWHPNGQCIPAVRKLFIDVNGIFYPCEKIIENDALSIGNLDNGFYIPKIIKFMNIGKLTEEECKYCWAIRFCNMCVSSCHDVEKNEITSEQRRLNCFYQKEKVLSFFKGYIDQCKI